MGNYFGLRAESQNASLQPATPSLDIQSHASPGQNGQNVAVRGHMTAADTGCSNTVHVNMSSSVDPAKSSASKGAAVMSEEECKNSSPEMCESAAVPSTNIHHHEHHHQHTHIGQLNTNTYAADSARIELNNKNCSSNMIIGRQGVDEATSVTTSDAELRILKFINQKSHINTRDELDTTFEDAKLSRTALKVFPQIAENSQFYNGDHAVENIPKHSKKIAEYVRDRKFCFQSNSGDISCSYEDVLKMIEAVTTEESTQVILLVAQAGAGKTVGMKRWARSIIERSKITSSGSFAPDSRFQLVLFKSFKSIQHKESTNLKEILFGGICENDDAKLIYNWAVKNDSKVSIFIDGLDQTPWTIEEKHFEQDLEPFMSASTETVIGHLLSRKLLPGATIVISSREFKAAALPYQARPKKVLTLLGFSETDAEQLFDELVLSDEEKKQSQESSFVDNLRRPWKKLSTDSPLLTGFLTIPVFLMFGAIVYLSTQAPMPVNVTGLLVRLLSLLKRSSHVKQAQKITNVIHKLKKVAHDGMVKGSVLFTEEDLRKNNIDPIEVIDLLFKVPGKTELSQRLFEEDFLYFFCHQSLQEFLSACFIVEMNLEEFKKFMEENCHQPRWSVTRRFIFGIVFALDDKELVQITDQPQKQEILLEMLKNDIRSKYGHELLEIFYSLYESRQAGFISCHVQNIILSGIPLGNSEIKLLNYIIRQSRKLKFVNLDACNLTDNLINLLISDLQDGIKINILGLLGNKLPLAILNSFLDKFDVDKLSLDDDDIAGNSGLNLKNVSHLHVKITEQHSLKIEKETDSNQMFFSGNFFRKSTVNGSLKKNEIMAFQCHETDAYIIHCITVAEKYMSPRLVTSEATMVFSSQYVQYKSLERILLWNVNLMISEIVLDCMEIADISSSLVESFAEKYQVKVLNIAVQIDHKDIANQWMVTSTVIKQWIYYEVNTSSEFKEIAVTLKTKKVKNLRIIFQYEPTVDDLMFIIKNCNLANVAIILSFLNNEYFEYIRQQLQELAASVHVQLEVVDVNIGIDRDLKGQWDLLDCREFYESQKRTLNG